MKAHFLMLVTMFVSCQAKQFLVETVSKEEAKKEKGYDYRASIAASSSASSSGESSESNASSGSAASSASGESVPISAAAFEEAEAPIPLKGPEGLEEPKFLSMLDSKELETLQKLESGKEVDSKSKAELNAALKEAMVAAYPDVGPDSLSEDAIHKEGEAANPDEVDGDSKGQDYQWFPIRRGFPGGRIRWTGTRGVMSINGRK